LVPKLGNSQVLIEGESTAGKEFIAMSTIIVGYFKAGSSSPLLRNFSVPIKPKDLILDPMYIGG
jgi:hypothetical protein